MSLLIMRCVLLPPCTPQWGVDCGWATHPIPRRVDGMFFYTFVRNWRNVCSRLQSKRSKLEDSVVAGVA
eukprot:3361328-Pyramimonas_sp.AAC.1